MSNRFLPDATIPGYSGPLYPRPLQLLQQRYRTTEHAQRPIDARFLRSVVGSLTPFCINIELEERFETTDGTLWLKLSFVFVDEQRYVLLFPTPDDPAQQDGSVSRAHIALYAKSSDTDPAKTVSAEDQRIIDLARSLVALIEADVQMFYLEGRRRT